MCHLCALSVFWDNQHNILYHGCDILLCFISMIFLWTLKDIASKPFLDSIKAELYCVDGTVTLIEYDNAYNVIIICTMSRLSLWENLVLVLSNTLDTLL